MQLFLNSYIEPLGHADGSLFFSSLKSPIPESGNYRNKAFDKFMDVVCFLEYEDKQ